MNKNIKQKAAQLITEEFGGDIGEGEIYLLTENGHDFLLVVQNYTEVCVAFDIDTLEMVGLQPRPYVLKYGEKI